MRALLVYPTHENCREAALPYLAADISAACYPARRTSADAERAPNCWNPLADQAEQMGLSVVKTACALCRHRAQCLQSGYLGQLLAMQQVDVALCTHKRVEYSGFAELASDCRYVSIHENPIGLLRPRVEASAADLAQAQFVLNWLLNDPTSLNWFGEAVACDDEGHPSHSEELAIWKERLYEFSQFLSGIVDQLVEAVANATQTSVWNPEACHHSPPGIERLLFQGTQVCGATFSGQPWRLILSIATGQAREIAILVQERFVAGAGADPVQSKSVITFRDNPLPPTATTWLNDATLTKERLQGLLEAQVHDATPEGHLPLQKKAIQIPRDITRRTSPQVVASLLRGVLVDRPQFARIGIIGHSNHRPVIDSLEPEYRSRIVKTAYFGSGEERSSNDWHTQCDLIVVLGTPRVPPTAVAAYLLQVGESEAACRTPIWGEIRWEGVSESQEPVTITSRGYHDERWREAQRDLVRAAIIQAVGRGRGILETGCEVLVLSTEECGLPLSDVTLERLGASSVTVLEHLRRLSPENPNRYLLGKTGVSTGEIARASQLGLSRAREILSALEARGLVRKVGQRGGWLPLLAENVSDETTPSSEQVTPPPEAL